MLTDALQKLSEAISEVEQSVAALKSEHDPLASHIFISRPEYRRVNDTKSGKRREVAARLSYNAACELGNTRSVKVVAGRRREARGRECGSKSPQRFNAQVGARHVDRVPHLV